MHLYIQTCSSKYPRLYVAINLQTKGIQGRRTIHLRDRTYHHTVCSHIVPYHHRVPSIFVTLGSVSAQQSMCTTPGPETKLPFSARTL